MSLNCPPNTAPYNIKAGDTIYKLATRYNTTVPAIISANPEIKPANLIIGQLICIPRQKQYPACPEGNYYRIKAGDTLYSIAKFYNVSLADLKEANPGVNPDQLIVGQIICIPLATPPVTCPPGSRSYIIKEGDTFYSIAEKNNISVATIKKYNPNLNPEALLIGQKICLPNNQ